MIALLHVYILVLEMFLWQQPRTRKVFGTDAEFAAKSRVMAANQRLSTRFLAAGLIWWLWLWRKMFRCLSPRNSMKASWIGRAEIPKPIITVGT